MDWPKLALAKIGQIRMAKTGLAKIGPLPFGPGRFGGPPGSTRQPAMATKASCECISHVLQALTELNPQCNNFVSGRHECA